MSVSITITKAAIVSTIESLLWKYSKGVEGEANYKQVYNVQSEHEAYAVDNKVLSDSFSVRSKEVLDMMREFITGNINFDASTGDPSVTLNMPTRWNGREALLQSAVNRYVEDGMLSDWLNVTAPTEAAIYTTRLQQDEKDINNELYKKGAP